MQGSFLFCWFLAICPISNNCTFFFLLCHAPCFYNPLSEPQVPSRFLTRHQDRKRRHRPSKSPPRPHRGRLPPHVQHQRLRRAKLLRRRRQATHFPRQLHKGQPGQADFRLVNRRLQALCFALSLLGFQVGRPWSQSSIRHGAGRAQHHLQRLRAWYRGH